MNVTGLSEILGFLVRIDVTLLVAALEKLLKALRENKGNLSAGILTYVLEIMAVLR